MPTLHWLTREQNLKALLSFYAGQVKCIYIDPPYNTRTAHFEFYDNNLEHIQLAVKGKNRKPLAKQVADAIDK